MVEVEYILLDEKERGEMVLVEVECNLLDERKTVPVELVRQH